MILTWGKNQRFDITQTPRLNDIHYIDTLLSLCYYCTTGQLSSAFERELEKYLSLPITFDQTLPLFEHNPKNSEVDSLLKEATDGIRIFHTPDKKYKIYSLKIVLAPLADSLAFTCNTLKMGESNGIK